MNSRSRTPNPHKPPNRTEDDRRTRDCEILVLDDDATSLRIVEEVLVAGGHRCHAVTAPKTALSIAREREEIKVIVCDVYMPEMSGLEFVDGLNTLRLNRQMPRVLLMTAKPSMETAIEALRLGVRDFLVKPIRPTELLDAIRLIRDTPNFRHEQPTLPPDARIQQLMEHTEELARELHGIANSTSIKPPGISELPDTILLELVEALRRVQRQHSDTRLDDIAWNLLLELARGERLGIQLSVTDLVMSSVGASSTTSLRRLMQLSREGYAARTPDPSDGRRDFVTLTPRGRAVVEGFLDEAAEHVRRAYATSERYQHFTRGGARLRR